MNRICSLLLISMISCQSYFDKELETNIISSLNNFILKTASNPILEKHIYKNEKCNTIFTNKSQSSDFFFPSVFDSGFLYSSLGKEAECLANQKEFIFIQYRSELKNDSTSLQDQYALFLNQVNYTKALCLPVECSDFYSVYINTNDDKNQNLQNYLSKYNIHNVSIYQNITKKKDASEYDAIYKTESFEIVLWIIVTYMIIRLLFTLITSAMGSSDDDETTEDSEVMKALAENGGIREIDSQESMLFSKIEEDKSILSQITSSLSYIETIRMLFQEKNAIYNETDILEVAGLRFIMLFFFVMSQNAWYMLRQPHQANLVLSTISGLSFGFVRFSVLSVEALKIINGILFGFKLMAYIKKNGKMNITGIAYFKFYLKCIVSVLSFSMFYLFHFFLMEIGLKFSPTVQYEYFTTELINSTECIKNPLKIFIPFYFQYFGQTANQNCNTSCYKVGLFQMSEFYSFTVIMILVFILIKIKKRIVDIAIYALFWILIAFSYFLSIERHGINGGKMNIYHAFGPTENYASPHMFILFYFIGFNIGVMLFYYKDIANVFNEYAETLTAQSKDRQYMPFEYNFHVMKFYSKTKQWFKNIMIIISIILLGVVSCNYYYMMNALRENPNMFIFTGTKFTEFSYVYEPIIFAFIFSHLCVFILLSNNGTVLKDCLNSKAFMSINRIFFCVFSMSGFNVTTFHGIYTMDLYLDVKTIMETSFCIMFFSLFGGIFHVIMYEVIFRVIMKLLIRTEEIKEKKSIMPN